MNTTGKHRRQQKQIQSIANEYNTYQFFNILTSGTLLEPIEALSPDFRERLFPPTETLSMFITQCLSADRSCQNAVNQAAVARVHGHLPICSAHTGGYCKARQRLPLNMIQTLSQTVARQVSDNVPERWCWQGHRVRIVDGTTVSMPDTTQNQQRWPQQRTQAKGLGFPVARALALTCWATGVVIDSAIGPCKGKGGSEHSLFRSLEKSLSNGDVLLADALYSSYAFLASMQNKGVNILVEQNGKRKTNTDFRTGKRLGGKDHITSIKRPPQCPNWMTREQFEALPPCIDIREFKVGGKILITSLLDAKRYPQNALKHLYKSRWRVELTLRDIKQTLGMDVLACKSPDMVEKEFAVYLLAYNLIRLVMAQAAFNSLRVPATLSFKHCLQVWLASQQFNIVHDPECLDVLLNIMAQKTVGKRPGRVEPRAIKRRPKPIGFLMITRDKAREHIRKHGHTRSLK